MALVPYTNTGKNNMHIGGKVITPGETREVDETLIPDFGVSAGNPSNEDEIVRNPLSDILAGSVKEVADALIALDMAQLDELDALETNAEKPRKGVLEAIDNRRLELAQGDDANA